MAKNKNESSNNNRKVVAEEKKDNGGGDKKNEDSNSFKSVYKINMHCERCATKIKRCVKDFRGFGVKMLLTKKPKTGSAMAENKNESSNNNRKVVAEEKKDNGGGDKKNEDSNSFKSVYKINMHCERCATKIKRCVKDFRGFGVKMLLTKKPKTGSAMAENKNESSNNNRKVVAEEKKDNGGGDKKNEDSNSFKSVYKMDIHCEGCATKIKRCVKDFRGVQDAQTEMALNKLTVVGKVDPKKLRDKLSQKTKKRVEIVPPIPKTKKDGGGSSREDVDKKDGNGGGSSREDVDKKDGGGGDEGGESGGGEKRMDVFRHPGFGYYDHGYGYGNGFVNGYGHAIGREWEWICAWILRTLYPWVDLWVGTCIMHQICSVRKAQMLALSCEEGKTVF